MTGNEARKVADTPIAKRLEALMDDQNLSVRALGARLEKLRGWKPDAGRVPVQRMLDGRTPNAETVYWFAKALGVHEHEFMMAPIVWADLDRLRDQLGELTAQPADDVHHSLQTAYSIVLRLTGEDPPGEQRFRGTP